MLLFKENISYFQVGSFPNTPTPLSKNYAQPNSLPRVDCPPEDFYPAFN